MSRETVKKWFDGLQEALEREAGLAGLLDHSSMVGTAREFFVRRMLKTILPPTLHIGTGRVLGGEQERVSRQVDVIIYDPRCPFLELEPGMGLYFVDGVIATVEIKSTLDTDKLKTALDNCLSVMEIPLHPSTPVDMQRRIEDFVRIGMTQADAEQMVHRESTPRTYIFAFNSKLSTESTCRQVSDWYDQHEQFSHSLNPFLPSVISVPNTVGLQQEFWLHPYSHLTTPIWTDIHQRQGPGARIVMTFLQSRRHFGWLAIHLIQTVHEHLGLERNYGGVRRAIATYLPGREYFAEEPQPTDFYSVI